MFAISTKRKIILSYYPIYDQFMMTLAQPKKFKNSLYPIGPILPLYHLVDSLYQDLVKKSWISNPSLGVLQSRTVPTTVILTKFPPEIHP